MVGWRSPYKLEHPPYVCLKNQKRPIQDKPSAKGGNEWKSRGLICLFHFVEINASLVNFVAWIRDL